MAQTRFIHIRVNSQQLETIKNYANQKGQKYISDYIRNVLLNETPDTQQQIKKIYDLATTIYNLLVRIAEEKCQMKIAPSGKES